MTAINEIVAELAPTGTLRAGINLSNFLLVSGRDANDGPVGVAPDLARAIAEHLGVPVEYVLYPNPGALADAAGTAAWNIALLGAEPERAREIEFTPAYVEIQSTYLVPPNSPLHRIEDVDQPGIRIASTARTAYGLWLDRNIRHAKIVHAATIAEAYEIFVRDQLDALSGLRPRLLSDLPRMAGARILDGQFTAVQQSIGTRRTNQAGASFLRTFVAEAITSGLIARLIERHVIQGLSVAPLPLAYAAIDLG